ncbi:hypothetical protein GCM10009665_42350 [Kitasatospora nipponensis]|uniref:Uncharacterized protein n=1 Tax=Kitasatospora nipponensis TaxID=258049 RepID=A0ABN1WDP9_9ACTN
MHAPATTVEQRAEEFEALRRAACTIPTVRFGEPDCLDDLDLTVGEDWLLASWDDPRAEDVHQLLYWGRPIGWTAPLPDGLWGQAGHIAAAHRDAPAAVVLADPASAPAPTAPSARPWMSSAARTSTGCASSARCPPCSTWPSSARPAGARPPPAASAPPAATTTLKLQVTDPANRQGS